MSKITTILPTYKRQHLLMRAIDSVRSQTWKDISIAVRDNCSEDGTEGLVLNIVKIDPRIIYIKNDKNIGPFENLKQGLQSVETEFFSILSDDDYLEPEFYSEAMKLFIQYPDAGFVAFSVNIVDEGGKILNSNMRDDNYPIRSTYYNSEDGMEGYLHGIFPSTWTGYVFKKDVFSSIGFAEFNEVGYGGDILFIWHAASRFNFVVSNFRGANFMSHSQSASTTMVKYFDERFLYWWRNRMLIIRDDPNVSDVVKNKISKYYFTHSTKSFYYFKYYSSAAISLMINRIKKGQYKELSFEFIAMRSFLPWSILIGIKYSIIILIYLKLHDRSRSLRRLIRSATKSTK